MSDILATPNVSLTSVGLTFTGPLSFDAWMNLMQTLSTLDTATQFAMLSAFASVGRVWVGPLAGVLAESIGWPTFFLVSTVLALPALLLLWWLRAAVVRLEVVPGAPADD